MRSPPGSSATSTARRAVRARAMSSQRSCPAANWRMSIVAGKRVRRVKRGLIRYSTRLSIGMAARNVRRSAPQSTRHSRTRRGSTSRREPNTICSAGASISTPKMVEMPGTFGTHIGNANTRSNMPCARESSRSTNSPTLTVSPGKASVRSSSNSDAVRLCSTAWAASVGGAGAGMSILRYSR